MTQEMQQFAKEIIAGTAKSNPYTTTEEIVELFDEVYGLLNLEYKPTINFINFLSWHCPDILACYGFCYAVDNHIIDGHAGHLFGASITFFAKYSNIFKHLNKSDKKQLLFDLARDGIDHKTIETEVLKPYDSSRYEDAPITRGDYVGQISQDLAVRGNLLTDDGFIFPNIELDINNADVEELEQSVFELGCKHIEFKPTDLSEYKFFESNGYYVAYNNTTNVSYVFWPRNSGRCPVPLWTTGWWLYTGDEKISKAGLIYREWIKTGMQLAKTGKVKLGKNNKNAEIKTYRIEMQCTHYAYVKAESAEEAETYARYYDENPIFTSIGQNWNFDSVAVEEIDLPEQKRAKYIARGSSVGDWWDDDVFDSLGCKDSKLPWRSFDEVFSPPEDKIIPIDPAIFVYNCVCPKFIWRNLNHLTCYELDGYYIATTSYDDEKFCYIFWPDNGEECPTKMFTG
jgi:hypothetical protein